MTCAVETALWIDWRQPLTSWQPGTRCYIGHETCWRRMPAARTALDIARIVADNGGRLSLVAPHLPGEVLSVVLRLVERLVSELEGVEVICSDWGLLNKVCSLRMGTPVVGRMLAGQSTDPRIARVCAPERGAARSIIHLDGTRCTLRRKVPTAELIEYYQRCWVDRTEVLAFLGDMGIRRCEISNTLQGVHLAGAAEWSFSLHMDEVPVAIMPCCPDCGENFTYGQKACEGVCLSGSGKPVEWQADLFPSVLFRRDNALFYRNKVVPLDLQHLPVDRLVYSRQ